MEHQEQNTTYIIPDDCHHSQLPADVCKRADNGAVRFSFCQFRTNVGKDRKMEGGNHKGYAFHRLYHDSFKHKRTSPPMVFSVRFFGTIHNNKGDRSSRVAAFFNENYEMQSLILRYLILSCLLF